MQGNAGTGRRWRRAATYRLGLSALLLAGAVRLCSAQDSTIPYQSVRVGNVVAIAAEAQADLAMQLAELADVPHDWPGLGRRDPGPLRLVVVENQEAMRRYTNGRAPSWGAALAFPSRRTILLRADIGGLPQTLRHELAHLALHDAINGRVPLWFDEGYAGMAAGEWNRLDVLRLSWIVLRGRSPDFVQISAGLRGNAREAEDAYALAMSAVLELGRRVPGGELAPLFDRLEGGEQFDAALMAVTGLSAGQFEAEWQRMLRSRYNILIWLAAGGLWGVIGLALGFALWYRRRSDRPRRAALDVGWTIPEENLPGEDVTAPTAIDGPVHNDGDRWKNG